MRAAAIAGAPSPTIAPSRTITQPTDGIGRGLAELRPGKLDRPRHEALIDSRAKV